MTMSLKQIDKAILVAPGERAILKKRDTIGEGLFASKDEGEASLDADTKAIDALQDRLWAERTRALLVVLQGIDTSGKDGTVRGVFGPCGPLGVVITPFGAPSSDELAHEAGADEAAAADDEDRRAGLDWRRARGRGRHGCTPSRGLDRRIAAAGSRPRIRKWQMDSAS